LKAREHDEQGRKLWAVIPRHLERILIERKM
jgi:hypothetical protein